MTTPKTITIGDRFKWIDHAHNDSFGEVWEIISDKPKTYNFAKMGWYDFQQHEAICVVDSIATREGYISTWNFYEDSWEYLGNYRKSANFISLYNLLK